MKLSLLPSGDQFDLLRVTSFLWKGFLFGSWFPVGTWLEEAVRDLQVNASKKYFKCLKQLKYFNPQKQQDFSGKGYAGLAIGRDPKRGFSFLGLG